MSEVLSEADDAQVTGTRVEPDLPQLACVISLSEAALGYGAPAIP
jgi:hypothetical protein